MHKALTADQVIQDAYDCVVEAGGWDRLLASYARVVGADSGFIFLRQQDSGPGTLVATYNDDVSARTAKFFAYYEPRDPKRRFYRDLPEGEVRPLGAFAFSADYRETEFFQDWVRQRGVADLLGSHLVRVPQLHAWMSLFRAERRGAYTPAEIRAARRVAPHLTRALKLRTRLDTVSGKAGSLKDALNRLGFGVALVDSGATLLLANEAAEAIFAAGDGLLARHDRVACVHPRDTAALLRRLGALTQASAAMPLPISRRDGRPLMVHLVPVSSLSAWCGLAPTSSSAALFIIDPMKRVAAVDGFAAAYGLTAAEARVLREIMTCSGLVQTAATLHIAVPTARTHLQNIFMKTDTQNQADLVRLVMSASLPLQN